MENRFRFSPRYRNKNQSPYAKGTADRLSGWSKLYSHDQPRVTRVFFFSSSLHHAPLSHTTPCTVHHHHHHHLHRVSGSACETVVAFGPPVIVAGSAPDTVEPARWESPYTSFPNPPSPSRTCCKHLLSSQPPSWTSPTSSSPVLHPRRREPRRRPSRGPSPSPPRPGTIP